MSAAEARRLRIPLAKRKVLPAGHDPRMTLLDARRTRAAIRQADVHPLQSQAHTNFTPAIIASAAAAAPKPRESDEIEDLLEFILEDTL